MLFMLSLCSEAGSISTNLFITFAEVADDIIMC